MQGLLKDLRKYKNILPNSQTIFLKAFEYQISQNTIMAKEQKIEKGSKVRFVAVNYKKWICIVTTLSIQH